MLPYWEHLKISHLLDPMHIFKNVPSSLWGHISSKESGTFVVRRYLISSKTKKKHWPIQETRGEVGPSFSFKEGDVPWILRKDDILWLSYNECEGAFFIWVFITVLLHYGRLYVVV